MKRYMFTTVVKNYDKTCNKLNLFLSCLKIHMIDNFSRLLDEGKKEFNYVTNPPAEEKRISQDFSIYCSNMPYDYQESEIKEMFGLYGTVHAVDPFRPKGVFHGVLFVRMDNLESCKRAAQALNGKTYRGREMFVSVAHDREQRDRLRRERRERNANNNNNYRNDRRNDYDNASGNQTYSYPPYPYPYPPYPYPPYPYPYPPYSNYPPPPPSGSVQNPQPSAPISGRNDVNYPNYQSGQPPPPPPAPPRYF